jgi:zinc/manganese transport system substrate-binding protein
MILICLCMVLALASGCSSGGDGSRVEVVATTVVAADVVQHVAGPDAEVDALISGAASPHDYGASAKDRARLEEADLVVAWGRGVEGGLPLDDLDDDALELSAGERDPHIWMDPTRLARELPALASALAEADPKHAGGYRRRARAYARELALLDREVERTLARVPLARRKLVTSHDSLGHFARRYGFSFLGSPSGLTPEAQPSAERIEALARRVDADDVPAVFAEATDDAELMRQIAREAGAEVVDDLLIEGFGAEVDGYAEMLRHDARVIAEALAP